MTTKEIVMVRHKYTEEEIEFLRQNAYGTPLKILTKMFNERFNLNISELSIRAVLHKNSIKIGINSGCFKKGNVSFNKGKKQIEYMSKEGIEKSKKTRFTKGKIVNNQDNNWLPIGAEIEDKDGYIYVRTKEPLGNKSHRFLVSKHKMIYEQHHGKVPKGHKVIFADGNKRNFNIDNLILVSSAELLYMNSNKLYYKGFPEGTKTGSIIAKMIMKGVKRKNEK